MNNLIKKYFVLFLVLVTGLLWLEANAAKPEKITVTEAIPSDALQGQGLPVRIRGSGFGPGASIKFLVTGTRDDTQIDVGTVAYDGDTGDLVADIQVLDAALVIDYDIEVRTSSGRRGKGTTLFAVKSICDDPERWHPRCDTGAEGIFTPVDITAGYDSVNAWEEVDPYLTNTPGWEDWMENILSVVPRPCLGNANDQLPSAGMYFCSDGDASGGRISIDLAGAGMDWVDVTPGKKQKYPGFCKLLNVWDDFSPGVPLRFGVTWYAFIFGSGCTPGQCPLRITTQSYSGTTQQGYVELHPFRNLTNLPNDEFGNLIADLPDVGPLTVFGDMNGTSSVNFELADNELNVFTVPQYLPVGQFRIEFKQNSGPSRSIASCETRGAVNNVWFVTEPR